MISLAMRTIRHRGAAFAGAFVALLCAAALVCACGMLLETGLRGSVAPERYAGTPVVVTGDRFARETIRKSAEKTKTKAKPLAERAWVPVSLAERLRRLPGVSRVVTEVTFPLYVAGRPFEGHGWESAALTPFTLSAGRAPRTDGEVAVEAGAGLRPGARVPVRTPAGDRTYLVTGVTAQDLPGRETLFLSPAEARRLTGRPGMVSAVGVFPAVDVSAALREAAAAPGGVPALAATGDERGAVEFPDAEQARVRLISLGGALGGTSLLVAILVVVGTSALSVQQRQREIALLRAVAATPRQVRKMLGGEALLVGAVAGLIGAAVGIGLGFWLRSRFVALGAMPPNLRLVVSPFPVFAALAATVAAAWAASRLSARRAVRIRPVEALGEVALPAALLPTGRLVAGLLCAGGGLALTLVLSSLSTEAAASPVTMLTALVWTVAVALLGPLVARVAATLLGAPLRAFRASGHLAAANLRAGAPRLASIIAPLSLMVAMTCTILFTQTTVEDAARREAAAGTVAGHVLGPHLPSGAAAALRGLPGVEAVTEVLHTSVRVGLEKYGAQGVTGEGLGRTLDLGVVAGRLDGLGEDAVAVSRTAAERLGVRVGGRLRLTLGDGTPADLRVTAVYRRGLGFGDLTLSHALVARHVDDPLGTALVSAPSLTRADLARAVPGTGVAETAGAAWAGPANAEVNYVAMGLIIAFTAIAVVNTLAMSTSARSRELALLRLVGTTRRQARRMLGLETLVALAVAVALGTGIALVTLTAFSTGMTGSAAPYVPPLGYLAVVGAAALLALAATALPARVVLARHPAEAVGARE
ncbi:ABC transporter permease [Streptosporangium sandarakinum]|uniref:Putative ABC transport system permease protein n=1 Tax=Streptosporangium sandarakinum TaxID=1260955 RepID=A0A852V0Z0_9ACTN|nr:ABC transporter permease [Streptosporangium sandarakinum]NYF41053.1 putative ABC transport system permease protein [Streptosporangium sandarakinum]